MIKRKHIFSLVLLSVLLLTISTVSANVYDTTNNTVNENIMTEENENINIELDESFSNSCDFESDNSEKQGELDTSGVIMSGDSYSCGAASFATVLNNLGRNITLDEAKHATNTSTDGTTMNNIINAAKKYNLTAYALNINPNNLKENYIIHMNIIGVDHWSVVKTVTNESIILADPNLGNYEYNLLEFNQYYTNQTVIITESTRNNIINNVIPMEPNYISEIGQKYISGKGYAYYVSKTMGSIPDKPKGPVIRYTIIVPKWGGKTIKLSTTKLTKHKISTKVVYTIKVYSKSNYKGKVETIYQPAFFNFAHKSGHNYSVTRKTSFSIQSIKWTVNMFPFPYS